MAFPSTLDTITATPASTAPLSTSHVDIHTAIKTLLESIEAKVGVDASAVATSLDYLIKNTTGGHEHDGVGSKKVALENIDPSAFNASEILGVNAGQTEVISTGKTVPSGSIVGTSDSQTLTNKTIDTAGPNTIKVNGNILSASAGTATVTIPNSTDTLVGKATTDILTNKTLTSPVIRSFDGWLDANETWTYASTTTYTNSNTTYSGTFTISGDLTTKYFAGMFIKFTQTTVKYGIITKVAYGAPNTTVTVFFGTDYSIANAAITAPYYAFVPGAGFPRDKVKWSVLYEDTTDRTPAASATYVQVTSAQLSAPLGQWIPRVKVSWRLTRTASGSGETMHLALSTATNSANDNNYVLKGEAAHAAGGTSTAQITGSFVFTQLNVAADATYYLIHKEQATATSNNFANSEATLEIEFINAYL